MIALRLSPLVLAAACAMTAPQSDPADRLTTECALLSLAGTRMGENSHPGLTEGCPGNTARDTRPLARQTASLRAANAAALPSGLTAGTRAEGVFRRMITRGVPPDLAAALTSDPAFERAAQ